ncbi:sensor histidine kinase [Pontibacter vulgaris]|uniref:sensor histidine kinase n=1 Tax=Pontibacter vulgaris TaxID=2905679 RepID=UPI001FA766CD|nr:HAMP domain-containing sensor histidine kinase [Pontibacter vulgaris]
MKFYFFRSAPEDYIEGFRIYSLPQNLKNMRLVAYVMLGISFIVLASNAILKYDKYVWGAAYYRVAYISYLISSGFALSADYFLRKKIVNGRFLYQRLLHLIYGFTFAITCLLMSVAVQGNPVNNMTMYLLGLILVAVLWILELREALLLVLLTELIFVVGLSYLSLTPQQLILNQTGSVFILLFFFILSRLHYSFRLNHYMQLKQIEEQKSALEAANKAKTSILGIVAHDLRSPYASIEMLIKLIQKKMLSAEREETAYELILKSCTDAKSTINDLLEMARYEQETPLLHHTNINDFLEEVSIPWQMQLKNSRQFQLHLAEMPVYVNIDPDRFKRVLDNIISNAVKFTNENGLIRIELEKSDSRVSLQISDNGIGIPDHLKPHLFESFSKASRKGIKGEHSVGLGLSIVKALVQQHGGEIEIDSSENVGTTFRIHLPANN